MGQMLASYLDMLLNGQIKSTVSAAYTGLFYDS